MSPAAKILLSIYLWSIILSALHVFLMGIPLTVYEKDKYMKRNADDFNDGPLSFRIAIVVIPAINTFIGFLCLMLLATLLNFYFNMLRCNIAAWGTKRLMGPGKYFKIREFIVRKLFTRYLDCFYKSFDEDPVNKSIVRMYQNLYKNDKKRQSKQDSEHDTDASSEETPDGR